jgi:hypothetical protein
LSNIFLALQIFAAFFLTLFGLAELFRSPGTETGLQFIVAMPIAQRFVAALLSSLGMTFLSLITMNVKKMRGN